MRLHIFVLDTLVSESRQSSLVASGRFNKNALILLIFQLLQGSGTPLAKLLDTSPGTKRLGENNRCPSQSG